MGATWSIARRDLVAAFTTPLAWLVIACWLLLTNAVFVAQLFSVHGTHGAPVPLYTATLEAGIYFLIFLAPAITMNAFAAERAQGTMQLLLTVPVREMHLVLGKVFAAVVLLSTLVALTLVQVVVLAVVSTVHLPHLIAGYTGMFLACVLFAGLGTWISLLVDSPVAAYVLTFAAIMVLALLSIGGQTGGPLAAIDAAIGLTGRTSRLFAGEIRLGDLAWFIGMSAAFVLLAHGSLRARRIHG